MESRLFAIGFGSGSLGCDLLRRRLRRVVSAVNHENPSTSDSHPRVSRIGRSVGEPWLPADATPGLLADALDLGGSDDG